MKSEKLLLKDSIMDPQLMICIRILECQNTLFYARVIKRFEETGSADLKQRGGDRRTM